MNARLNQPWVAIDRIESFIQLEPALVLLGLGIGALFFYKLLLKDLSPERHRLLKRLFTALARRAAMFTAFFFLFAFLRNKYQADTTVERITSYIGLITLFWGAAVFSKTCKIIVNEYLFYRSKKAGVPVLLVDFITLGLTILVVGWIITELFSLKIAPVLATSAVFSLVLGLALQDTLGNLMAGIALQFDPPCQIGDWVEIYNGGQKWVGQVLEISWRATVLLAFGEEILTIPNRIMAQAEVANFSAKSRPFIRGQSFRVPYGTDTDKAKKILLEATRSVPAVCSAPGPIAWVYESAESWIVVRVIYWIRDYCTQYTIADQVLTAVLGGFEAGGISLASPVMAVHVDATAETTQGRTHEAAPKLPD
jgi:small-conductance mechanosensitive channel